MRILIFFLLFQSTEPLSDRVLIQDHQHRPAAVAPMTLAAIEPQHSRTIAKFES